MSKSPIDKLVEQTTKSPEINVDITETSVPVKNKKCRKNVDYNAYELVFALGLCDSSLDTKVKIMDYSFEDASAKLKGCSEKSYKEYKNDVETRRPADIEKYLKNLHKNKSEVISEEIENVYLEGKTLKTAELKTLNKNIDDKQAKADVYVKLKSGTFIGFSIKQDDACTKTNFSVEKMLVELISDQMKKKEFKKEIADQRKQILKAHGIDNKNLKENRELANRLFYDSMEGTNAYWNALRNHIENKNTEIKHKLISNLFPVDLPYDLYEFGGDGFSKLNVSISDDNTSFKEHNPYYFDDKGTRRKTAKMFYKLVVNDKKYRVEVRFKGNAWAGAPQFLTHQDKKVSPVEAKKVSPEQAKKVSPEQAKKVSPEQAKKVSPEQAKKVSPEQAKKVSPEQAKKVSSDEIIRKTVKKTVDDMVRKTVRRSTRLAANKTKKQSPTLKTSKGKSSSKSSSDKD